MGTETGGQAYRTERDENHLVWQALDISREIRAQRMGQRPCTLWLTGLSGSGKSTVANELEKKLIARGRHTMLLDGDNIRMGLNRNLGFSEEDRAENIRRVAETAKLMNDAGLIVLTSFISPFRRDRQTARRIIGSGFVELYVDTPLEECERRDVKGLYRKARSGEIAAFTGVSSPYESPKQAEIVVHTVGRSIAETTEELLRALESYLT